MVVAKGDLDGDGPVLVFGVAYAPKPVDADRAAMDAEAVESMAYEFVASGKLSNVDLMHNERATGSKVVDSTIIRWENPYFPIGAWVVGTMVYDPMLKAAIKRGEINGYSFGGSAFEVVRFALILKPLSSAGTTELSTEPNYPEHDHELTLKYDDAFNIIPTETEEALGHRHIVMLATATEMADGHAHRLVIELPKSETAQTVQELIAA